MPHRALALTLLVAAGCEEPAPPADERTVEEPTAEQPAIEATAGPTEAGPIPPSWVEARVAEARERLGGSEAGQLVWQAIEAQGGLATWLAEGTIAFAFDYQPVGQPERRMHTHQMVDLWRARAVHRELEGGAGAEARLGWDGEKAWITPDAAAFPSPARFWALTPYYFVGMPFVVADPGAHYDRLEDAVLDGQTYRIVKVTYEPGTGDSPDDYYILYLHPETHELAALRYVVAYPGFFPEGGHTPEKLMRYTDRREIGGLSIAHRLDTYAWDTETGEPGDEVTAVEVRDVTFGETWPASVFAPPEGAVIMETIEARAR